MPRASGAAPATPDPYDVFRPRRGRRVASTMAVLSLLIFAGGAISLPGVDPLFGGWDVPDRLLLVGCGAAISAFLWRYATIRAVPSTQGLVIRNLLTTRTLQWAQIVDVLFGGGAPWVLDDTDTVAVMAIQKADGAFGRAEAARLSALVQVHSRPRPTS